MTINAMQSFFNFVYLGQDLVVSFTAALSDELRAYDMSFYLAYKHRETMQNQPKATLQHPLIGYSDRLFICWFSKLFCIILPLDKI